MEENNKERIGNYELIELIGDGAQGRVYRARCVAEGLEYVELGEEVALKVVRMAGEDDSMRIRFMEQAEILRRLSHTSIVSYRDCFTWRPGEWDEAQCLVMELLIGEPLSERVKKAGSGLPWPQVEEIFEQCLSALIHARECGITHRDIKPSNIFLTVSGVAKLIDFDIARQDESSQLSTAGWKGTFDYMAPDFITVEGFRGDEVSDIFSLGVCFYQALTGSLPFKELGEAAHIGYLNRWRSTLPPTPSYRPGVFRVLGHSRSVVARSVTMKREERYQSFGQMLEEFRKIRYRRLRHKGREEYELLAVLGRGGFGEVFKARRGSDGMLVAIKYLFSEKQSDRFIKEARILQQNVHPHLVEYVDFMIIEGAGGDKQYFLVMEFLEGMPGWTLRYRIRHDGAIEPGEVVALFSGYLSALQTLHSVSRPIIHRDIKPGNLYAPVGQPDKGKIFDLGVARDVSGTVTVGGVPGTLDYMPPEFGEAGGDRGSPQSDLYALGLCLYESLTGKPVFERLPHDMNSAWAGFQDRIKNPPAIDYEAEVFQAYPRFRRLIERALAINPVERHGSALEMREDLNSAMLPEAVGVEEDDIFGAGEVTMATFAGAMPDEGEEGVTLGTRPLEMLGDGVDLVALGEQVAKKKRGGRRLLIVGVVLGLMLVMLGGAAIVGVGVWRLVKARVVAVLTEGVTEAEDEERVEEIVEEVGEESDEGAGEEVEVEPEGEVEPEVEPVSEPEVVVEPKVEPEPEPEPELEPELEPEPVVEPKVEPKVEQLPKVDVKPEVVEPKPVVKPAIPKVEEPKKEPKPEVKVVEPPKVEVPKVGVVVEPEKITPPKVEVPKVEEPKAEVKVEPRVEPVKPEVRVDVPKVEPKVVEPKPEVRVVEPPKEEVEPQVEEEKVEEEVEAGDVAAGEEMTAFNISVIPRTAVIKVNGKVVLAGRIGVEPDENHQVQVSCKGYKTVEQYYRVKPGETRRIDVMLEKEVKRSIFRR